MLAFDNVLFVLEHYGTFGTIQSRVVPLLWELVSDVMEAPLHIMECVLCAVFWCGASCLSWRHADPRTGFKGNGIPLQSRAWHSHAGCARMVRAWKQKSPLSRAIKNPAEAGLVEWIMLCLAYLSRAHRGQLLEKLHGIIDAESTNLLLLAFFSPR